MNQVRHWDFVSNFSPQAYMPIVLHDLVPTGLLVQVIHAGRTYERWLSKLSNSTLCVAGASQTVRLPDYLSSKKIRTSPLINRGRKNNSR